MKKLALPLLFVLVAVTGCEGDDNGTGGTGGGGAECDCTPDYESLKRCVGDVLEVCDGCSWQEDADCTTVEGNVCVDEGLGQARCQVAPASLGAFEECQNSDIPCATGLTCSLHVRGDACGCIQPCADNPSVCGADAYCDTDDYPAGACTALGGPGALCDTPADCLSGMFCLAPTGTPDALQCVRRCTTTADCSEAEYCETQSVFGVSVCKERPGLGGPCRTGTFEIPCSGGFFCTAVGAAEQCAKLCQTDPSVCGDDEYCNPSVGARPICQPRASEYDGCLGPECPLGLLCSEGADGNSYCVRPCGLNPSLCGSGEACDPSFENGACIPAGGEFDQCGASISVCASGLTCSATTIGPETYCVRACDGTPGQCDANEYCDLSGVFEEGACLPVVGEGEACEEGLARCGFGLTCSENVFDETGICVRRCVDDPSVCDEDEICDTSGAFAESTCVPVVGELEPCGPGVAGCYLGLTCSSAVGSSEVCVSGCATNPSACTVTQYCDTALSGAGVCMERGRPLNSLCSSGAGCADGLQCTAAIAPSKGCKQPCSGGEVGTQGSCPAGQTCLAGPGLELQPGGGINGVLCNAQNPVECDGANGYVCMAFSTGLGSQDKCARPVGVCGSEAKLLTSLTRADLSAQTPEDVCGLATGSGQCAALPEGVTAKVECTATGFATPISVGGLDVECASDEDCVLAGGELLADAECANFSSGAVCAVFSRGCVALCESDLGTDLTCPEGTTCQVPKPPHLGVGGTIFAGNPDANCDTDSECGGFDCVQAPLVGGGTAGFCFDACASDADCEADFYCDDYFGTEPICIRTLKVCLATGSGTLTCE